MADCLVVGTFHADPTRSEIRRIALQQFGANGYDATSIRDVARAVGIQGASMYHHFASKEEILWDLTCSALDGLEDSWQEARRRLRPSSQPIEQLRAFVSAHVRFHIEHRADANLVNAQLKHLSREHYAQAVSRRDRYEQELLTIVQACRRDDPSAVPDLRITVFAILQMASSVTVWYRPDGPLSVDELCETYEALALKMVS